MRSWRILFLFALLLVLPSIRSTVNSTTSMDEVNSVWYSRFDGGSEDRASSLIQTIDGGFIMIGFSLRTTIPVGDPDIWVVKTDSEGSMEWNARYGGLAKDYGNSIVQTKDNGYLLSGWTKSYGLGEEDFWLIKIDTLGNTLWNKTFGGLYEDRDPILLSTSDDGFALIGSSSFTASGNTDFHMIKIDEYGNKIWNGTYGGMDYERVTSAVQTSDDGFIIGGTSYGSESFDMWAVKTDSLGISQWNNSFGGHEDEYLYSIIETTDSGFGLIGWTKSFGAGSFDQYFVKTDNQGELSWNKTYGGIGVDMGNSLIQTSDQGFIIIGSTSSIIDEFDDNILLTKTNQAGNVEWNTTYGTSERYNPSITTRSLIQTSDGGLAFTGSIESLSGHHDFLLVKTDFQGSPIEIADLITDSTNPSISTQFSSNNKSSERSTIIEGESSQSETKIQMWILPLTLIILRKKRFILSIFQLNK